MQNGQAERPSRWRRNRNRFWNWLSPNIWELLAAIGAGVALYLTLVGNNKADTGNAIGGQANEIAQNANWVAILAVNDGRLGAHREDYNEIRKALEGLDSSTEVKGMVHDVPEIVGRIFVDRIPLSTVRRRRAGSLYSG